MQIEIHLLKRVPLRNLNPEVDFQFMAAILKNRYDVIPPPPIIGLLQNLAGGCKMTSRYLHTGQNRNRKYNSNKAAVRFL